MNELIEIIKKGGTVVIPTDTILGIACSAYSKKAVERIYEIRERNKNKPLIILISDISELKKFGVKNIPKVELRKIWPNKVSIIFDIKSKKFNYLHKGTNSLCFRMPKSKFIKNNLHPGGNYILIKNLHFLSIFLI